MTVELHGHGQNCPKATVILQFIGSGVREARIQPSVILGHDLLCLFHLCNPAGGICARFSVTSLNRAATPPFVPGNPLPCSLRAPPASSYSYRFSQLCDADLAATGADQCSGRTEWLRQNQLAGSRL